MQSYERYLYYFGEFLNKIKLFWWENNIILIKLWDYRKRIMEKGIEYSSSVKEKFRALVDEH